MSESAVRKGYRVRITYSEPGFHWRNPHLPSEYSSVFELPEAKTPDAAVREAMARWDDYLRHSGVGWHRVITSVTVEA